MGWIFVFESPVLVSSAKQNVHPVCIVARPLCVQLALIKCAESYTICVAFVGVGLGREKIKFELF